MGVRGCDPVSSRATYTWTRILPPPAPRNPQENPGQRFGAFLAMAVHRDGEALRPLVDTVPIRLYRNPEDDGVYARFFGQPDAATHEWFKSVAEPV